MNFFSQFLYWILSPFYTLMSSPMSILTAPKRLFGMSLPTRVAVFVGIFLVTLTIVTFVVWYKFTPDRAAISAWKETPRLVTIAVLLIVIPVVVHRAMKLWLEEDVSRFPDIDDAWRSGIQELAKNGFDLSEWPLFIIFGPPDHVQARVLMEASGMELKVRTATDRKAAIHWFAGPHGIFLVCTEAGRVSRLSDLSARAEPKPKSLPGLQGATRVPGGGGAPVFGTMDFGNAPATQDMASLLEQPSSVIESPSGDTGMSPQPAYLGAGTMQFGGATPNMPGVLGAMNKAQAKVASVRLSKNDAMEQAARLLYVCDLVRQARQPLCPINGILTVLPFPLIDRGDDEGVELQNAIRADLETIHQSFRLRCQVVAMVGGMESEAGFRELVRRVGKDAAKMQRFGKGFKVWNLPIPEQVEAVATHASAAFEDWTYALFREKDGLMKNRGNMKLYSLLCKIRTELTTRFKNILVLGFACEEQPDPSGTLPLLFGGCYFAATGEKADRQAFVKSVFDKLVEQEEDLDWTNAAVAENARYQRFANLALFASLLLILAMGGMLVKKFLLNK